ncbi:hypothetical protein DSM14862_03260 (plasmid) [Sulfitobacter indolifex]|nr:hypothetical protein DSM14862_03260 [Sulfitobacter indolifex]
MSQTLERLTAPAAPVAPAGATPALLVSTIERRLSGLAWYDPQRGFELNRKDRLIAPVLAEDLIAKIASLSYDLRGLRDRAILLLSYAGGLRRS